MMAREYTETGESYKTNEQTT